MLGVTGVTHQPGDGEIDKNISKKSQPPLLLSIFFSGGNFVLHPFLGPHSPEESAVQYIGARKRLRATYLSYSSSTSSSVEMLWACTTVVGRFFFSFFSIPIRNRL